MANLREKAEAFIANYLSMHSNPTLRDLDYITTFAAEYEKERRAEFIDRVARKAAAYDEPLLDFRLIRTMAEVSAEMEVE